jgi:hypothetical protein
MVPGIKYLEIGLHYGSTLASILKDNQIRAVAIDSWNGTNGADIKASFFVTIQQYVGNNTIHIIPEDCWTVDLDKIYSIFNGKVTVYFFDGPHERVDHFLALAHFYPVLDDTFIFIVDDWNWAVVKSATYAAIESLNLKTLSKIEVSTADYSFGKSQWHNGMVAFVLQKTIIGIIV